MTRLFLILSIFTLSSWTINGERSLYSNYKKAVKSSSTFQYYLVIHVTDINTGITREICTKGNFLKGAIHREYNLDYDDSSLKQTENIALKNRKRSFKFKNPDALKNLGLDRYTEQDLKEFNQRVDIEKIINQLDQGWEKKLSSKEMLLYAHSLFNHGVLTGENSHYGGTLKVIRM